MFFNFFGGKLIKKQDPNKRSLKEWEEFLFCAKLCQMSYKELLKKEETERVIISEFYKYLVENGADVHLFEISNTEGVCVKYLDKIYICLRGSEELEDFVDDLNIVQKKFVSHDKYCGKIHKGFYAYYKNSREEIQNFLKNNYSNDIRKIIFTGHSLGASVSFAAVDYCLDLKYTQYEDEDISKVWCITLGSPRLGDSDFVNRCNKLFPHSFRLVNTNDYVTTVPFMFNYSHILKEVRLNGTRSFNIVGVAGSMVKGAFNDFFSFRWPQMNPIRVFKEYTDCHMIDAYITAIEKEIKKQTT